MPAGTIKLTNNSTAVTGTGTSFTTELKPNDFIVAVVGGVPYTLGVDSVTSNTALVIKTAYNGPTTSALAWTPIPNGTLVGITSQVAADVARAIRGLNLDKANWQQVFSGTGNITVNLPDGSSFTGPAWNSLTNTLNDKAAKGANSDITSLSGMKTALSIAQGGTGSKNAQGARDNLGLGTSSAVAIASLELNSDRPFIDFHYGSSGEDYTSRIIPTGNEEIEVMALSRGRMALKVDGGYRPRQGTDGPYGTNIYNFYWTGSQMTGWVDTSNRGAISFIPVSDKGLKEEIAYTIESVSALEEVMAWRPAYFKMKPRGDIPQSEKQLGFIANDLIKVSEECVSGKGLAEDYSTETDPNAIDDAYYLNPIAISAKLTLAVHTQQKMIEDQTGIITELQKRLKALDGLDA